MEQALVVGYARVSTVDQNLDAQTSALVDAGCNPKRIYTDKETGVRADRPRLKLAMEVVRPGDTLIVWKLDPSKILFRSWRISTSARWPSEALPRASTRLVPKVG